MAKVREKKATQAKKYTGATRKVARPKKRKLISLRALIKVLCALSLLLGVIYIGMKLPLESIPKTMADKAKKPIAEVNVVGEFTFLSKQDVQNIIASGIEDGFLKQELKTLKTRIESLAWVESVNIKRRWPDKLDVQVEEYKPIARWNNDGVITVYGNYIEVGDNSNLAYLPMLKGDESRSEEIVQIYVMLTRLLAEREIKIAEIEVNDANAWKVRLDGFYTIDLGKGNTLDKMKNFLVVYDSQLYGLGEKIAYVDVRYEKGVAVKWKQGNTNLVVAN